MLPKDWDSVGTAPPAENGLLVFIRDPERLASAHQEDVIDQRPKIGHLHVHRCPRIDDAGAGLQRLRAESRDFLHNGRHSGERCRFRWYPGEPGRPQSELRERSSRLRRISHRQRRIHIAHDSWNSNEPQCQCRSKSESRFVIEIQYFLSNDIIIFISNPQQTIGQWRLVFLIAAANLGLSAVVYTIWGTSDEQPWNFSGKPTETSPEALQRLEDKTKKNTESADPDDADGSIVFSA